MSEVMNSQSIAQTSEASKRTQTYATSKAITRETNDLSRTPTDTFLKRLPNPTVISRR